MAHETTQIPTTIDADTHLVEPLTLYRDFIGAKRHDLALYFDEDERGWPWLMHKGRKIHFLDDHLPGRVDLLGERRRRHDAGEPAVALAEKPADHSELAARLALLQEHGSDAAILFPNFGLLWEDCLRDDIPSLCANLEAYNTWLLACMPEIEDRIFPVAQASLRDISWFERELDRCARGSIKLVMLGAHPIGDKSLAHPDFDRVWARLQDLDMGLCFHVSQMQRPLDPAWYALDPEPLNKVVENVFLYIAPAAAVTSLIIHGKLEQFPRLRIGIVELSSRWVPEFLLHLDGGFDFYAQQHGHALTELSLRPSEYFKRQVRVGSFAIEGPAKLIDQAGCNPFMWGSDYPHAEGMVKPSWADYEAMQARPLTDEERAALRGGNAAFLLGLSA